MINISGIILLNKPLGISSNAALQKVKRLLKIKKAGHTGSLDPRASGMLPICIGQATKFSQFLLNANKQYTAKIKLGECSSTGDSEGEKTVICEINIPLDIELIKQAVNKFVGKVQQLPPMYSALKYKGQPLYKFARSGIDVPRELRDVQIDSIEIISYSKDILELDIKCSKGTYIRTLAEDIGKVLGTGAYLASLHRTSVGNFTSTGMYTLDELENISPANIKDYILPIEQALDDIESVEINDLELKKLVFGQQVVMAEDNYNSTVKIMHHKYGLVGIGIMVENGILAPKRLMQFDLTAL